MNNDKPYLVTKDLWSVLRENMEPVLDKVALQIKKDGVWQRTTYRQLADRVEGLAAYLYDQGIRKGDRVGLICENRPEWMSVYLGAVKIGAVIVPLDPNLKSPELSFILKNCQPKFLFFSTRTAPVVAETLPGLTDKPRLVGLDIEQKKADLPLLADVVVQGRTLLPKYPALPSPGVDDVAGLVYTSGTTGVPKGVPLTHQNIGSNVTVVKWHIAITAADRFLSILPLQHTFATTGDFFCCLFFGATQTFPESLKSTKILEVMQETHPTIILAVPLFFKILYDGIWREVESSAVKKAYFKFFFSLGSLIYRFFGLKAAAKCGRVFFKPLHKKFGDQIRFFISGGAPLDPEVGQGFAVLGILVIQGYGLTESSPILTANNVQKNKMGSVGFPLTGIEVKIDRPDDKGYGEIIARGPNIFSGYWHNDSETAKMLKDGWLRTGDQGMFDQDGFLFITGRLKDIIVTPAGENVSPEEVENAMAHSPFFAEVCVFGRKVPTGPRKGLEEVFAVIVPSREYFEDFAKKNGLALTDDVIKEKIKSEIDRLNAKLMTTKRVSDFRIISEPLPRTATRKVRRFVVKEKYSND